MSDEAAPTRGAAVRAMRESDGGAVVAIYAAGIEGGNATFETTAPSYRQWDHKYLADHRFVATDEAGAVIGWAAAMAVSSRAAYRGVVEASLYVAPGHQGEGVGSALLERLIASTEKAGIWTIQSSVFPENTASVALNAKFGFRVVGTRERIAKHHGRWRDTLLIERRSPLID